MQSGRRDWFDLPRPAVLALALPALVAGSALSLPPGADERAAVGLATVALVGAGAVAGTALVRRARTVPDRSRLAWWLLAAAAVGQVLWVLLPTGAPAGDRMPADQVNVGHVLMAVAVVTALLLLPGPADTRRGLVRTVLDAAAAGFSFAVPVCEVLLPAGTGLLGGGGRTLVHPAVDVALATVAVAVLARARHPGGLRVGPLAALAGGGALLAVADVLARRGGAAALVLALVTSALLLWAGAALVRAGEDSESDRRTRWRERAAVLAPLVPMVLAAAVLGGSTLGEHELAGVTLVSALLLAVTLIAGGVLARLDGLVTERTIDDLVLKRTVSLGTREKWFRSLVQNSSDVITVVDVRGVVRFVTPSVERIFGHQPDQLVGSAFTGLLRPADGRRLEAALAASARTPGHPLTLEFPMWASDGSWCDTETTVTSLVHDPDIRGLVLNSRDVSERRRLEAALTQQAYSDSLTGLANRALFRSKVEAALKAALRPGEVAVLFLDLDGFKAVNDSQGHHVGDELLTLVGRRLSNAVRPGDLVSRLGGDEFAILVTGPTAEEGATWVADRVRSALARPFVLDGREVSLSASTGLAVSDNGDETTDQLQRNADLAMYRAKADREDGFVRFEAEMHDALLARVKAESELRQGVARGDLVLHYQPVVDLADGSIIGVEALARWNHPEVGLVPPSDFIALAEETGLVGEIGRWALEESCRQGALWQRYAPEGGHFKMAVNVSAHQMEAGLPRLVRDLLASSGLPGPALTLEMTESVLIDRTEEVIELLRRTKSMGVRVAVDDFGTGYSSLSYLARFPVDILKIDQSFVQHVDGPGGQGELVRTIVALGQSLRLDTVAEGIETVPQRDTLRAMGCTYGQGYLFARPLPAEDVETLLVDQQRMADAAALPTAAVPGPARPEGPAVAGPAEPVHA